MVCFSIIKFLKILTQNKIEFNVMWSTFHCKYQMVDNKVFALVDVEILVIKKNLGMVNLD